MTTPSRPRLLLVAHGTRSALGRRVLGRVLLETRKALRPDGVTGVDTGVDTVDCRLAWVDVQSPGPERILADGVPTVVVPVFLARGFHVTHDVGQACLQAPGPVVQTPHLGSEPEVVRAVIQRLAEAGATGAFGADAVVLGAAGSRDSSSVAETRELAGTLSRLLGVPVTAAFASAAEPSVTDAVAAFRASGHSRVAVATHLLAPGFFADRLAAAGGDLTSEPLGAHPEVIDLIVRRYREFADVLCG
ncbi:sirohydrochlorin chelatase [Dietzia sp. NCCP-2495]|uniref:sirohydrochlorin chelatase n=1 Tax=Dietzia sp. NCCP-2495 TaxID=2934675 RepID=UPI0022316714|nr:CbiX/SirB N-terminal domain-containing protein [Dietzia sp. NCCP-2495]